MKPGYTTTEFYITLGVQVIAILVLLGYLDDAASANATWVEAVKGAAALIGAAATAWKYVDARARVKAGQ